MQKATFASLNATLAVLLVAPTSPAVAASNEAFINELATSVEQFYGKNVEDLDRHIAITYGVKGPVAQTADQYNYLVPAQGPACGGLNVQIDGDKRITSWHTLLWERTEDNQFGIACNKLLQAK
ncbi:MAG: hypothetical protein ACFCUG_10225 [Thiotrichales bacterium]